jgi:hypothetical protein
MPRFCKITILEPHNLGQTLEALGGIKVQLTPLLLSDGQRAFSQ